MKKTWSAVLAILACVIVATSFLLFLGPNGIIQEDQMEGTVMPAEPFSATDHLGRSVILNNLSGNVTILHITQLENPLCLECEKHVREQIVELEKVHEKNLVNVTIITVNIRKNPYSDPGWKLAEDLYGINVTWHWIEESSPYAISSQYIEYWTKEGEFANPTLIYIDPEFNVVGIDRIYGMNSGEIAGVQSSETLESNINDISSGEWTRVPSSGIGASGLTFGGMFLLGFVTSFSPCSLMFLFTLISYLGTREKGRSENDSKNVKNGFFMGLFFVVGMSLVFLLFGFLLAYIGLFVEMSKWFYLLAGIMLVLLGINAFKPLGEILRTDQIFNIGKGGRNDVMTFIFKNGKNVYTVTFILGILFSIGWAPCALSLVFPVVILLLAKDVSILTGGLLMMTFGFGHGAVAIPACMVSQSILGRLGGRFIKMGKWMQAFFGIAIILMGALFILRIFGIHLW